MYCGRVIRKYNIKKVLDHETYIFCSIYPEIESAPKGRFETALLSLIITKYKGYEMIDYIHEKAEDVDDDDDASMPRDILRSNYTRYF